MRSGQLARLIGVSPDTVRHYERLGLLAAPPRTSSGYRDYPPQSVERVRLIRRALSVGFSLPELRAILRVRDQGGIPCQRVRVIAKSKLQQVRQQIRDLHLMRNQLERILRDWNARLARTRRGQAAQPLEHLPNELVPGAPPMIWNARQGKKGKKVAYADSSSSGISRHRSSRSRSTAGHTKRFRRAPL